MSIFILDEVMTKPGLGEQFLTAYLTGYAPLAEANGLELVHRWVDPPLWLDDRSNRVLLVWRAGGPRELWRAKRAARQEPAVVAWWEAAASSIESRRRSVMAEAAILAELADV